VLLLAALIVLCKSAYSQAGITGKFRVELDSGERFVLSRGTLTLDSLVGTHVNGHSRSVPIGEIRSLQRRNGTYARKGAGLGALVGSVVLILNFIEARDEERERSSSTGTEQIPLKLIGIIGGSTLLGAGIGWSIDRWEAVSPGSPFGGLTDRNGWRVQLALSF
jgi:hypothetical protein